MPITETPFFFGEQHPLLGILSETHGAPRKTAVLLLNSGLVHRAGPFRLGVDIARGLSEAGFPVLRIDQSARGDSDRRRDVGVVDAAELDIDDAKAALRSRTGVDKIIMAGLCSGSDDVVRHVSKASDVDGQILMDPFAPRTLSYTIHHYLGILSKPTKIFRSIGRKLGHVTVPQKFKDDPPIDLGSFRALPDADQARAAFRQISRRGGASLCVFTSGVAYYYNHNGQLTNGLGLKDMSDSIEERFFKTAEHTYPLAAHRRHLIETIVDFCTRRFE